MDAVFSLTGRMNRKPFIIWYLVLAVVGTVASVVYQLQIGSAVPPPKIPAGTDPLQAFVLGFTQGMKPTAFFTMILSIILIWPWTALTTKRFHDRNKSIWWPLILVTLPMLATIVYAAGFAGLLPFLDEATVTAIAMGTIIFQMFAGIWVLIECVFLRGTRGPNAYGPDPIANDEAVEAAKAQQAGDWAG
ncbi:MAG: DUF805 domain-containing protein [Pseudomonadota bacterium]